MADQPPALVEFPSRLSRRLGSAVAIGVAAFLLVGGFLVFLSLGIGRLHRAVDEERLHIRSVGAISDSFHHLIFEIQNTQLTGRVPQRDLRDLHAALVASIVAVRDLDDDDKGLVEDYQAQAVLATLGKEAESLLPMVEALASEGPSGSRLPPPQLEPLSLIAHSIPDKIHVLTRTHEVRITHLLQASRRVERIVIVLYIAVFCIGCVLIAFAGRTLNRGIALPLHGLAGMARKIADGRLEARVPVTTQDEIGQLSHAFNGMADRLQARERELKEAQARLQRNIRELEALNEIASRMLAFNEPGGQDTILQFILEKARDLLRVEAAAICLWETDGLEMTLHSTSGPAEAFHATNGSLRIPAACREGGTHDFSCCSVIDAAYSRSHLAAPLKRDEKTCGMLCLVTREERTFTSEEAGLLRAFAAQAAITLEHSRLDAEVQRLTVLEERGRIARDMHDGLAQSLGLLYMMIRQAQAEIPPGQFGPLGNALEEMAIISTDMYAEVRRAIYGLRIMVPQKLGLIPTLTEFVREFGEQNHLSVHFEVTNVQTANISPGSEVQVVRIIQEALHNVRKHAKASQAVVRLEAQGVSLRLIVQDDGVGFDPSRFASVDGVHLGLHGMRERAERIGGTLEVESAPGKGTRVIVTLPAENAS